MNPLSAWRHARARRLERRVARAALAAEDAELARTGRVGAALFARFDDAHGYGTATPMSWLINRLRVLHRRVREGGTLELTNPAACLWWWPLTAARPSFWHGSSVTFRI